MASLRLEVGEQVTMELWTSFCGQRCGEEHARARRSELATVTPLRPRFWRERGRKEEMDASTSSGASSWRSCARSELTSGARDDVRMPSFTVVLTPVGHVDELGVQSDMAMID